MNKINPQAALQLQQLMRAATAAKAVAPATDPYAPIRRISKDAIVSEVIAAQPAETGEGARDATPETTVKGVNWDAVAGSKPFTGKYTGAIFNDERGMLRIEGAQQPGKHKYDTMDLAYKLDPATGDYVLKDARNTRQTSSLKSNLAGIAPIAGLMTSFIPGLGAALGGALGLSGTAAGVVGNALVSAGTSAIGGARGSDILKSGLAGGVGSAIGAAGKTAGWNPVVTRAVSGTAGSVIRGGDPRQALVGAVLGRGGVSVGNPVADALLRTIVRNQLTPRRG